MALVIFLFGLLVGSFLNAVIYRLHASWSMLEKSSRCPDCRHPLSWLDLVPIVSFFILRRKCRYCQKSISWQYPLVELATGIVFALIYMVNIIPAEVTGKFGIIVPDPSMTDVLDIAFQLVFVCFLIVIFVYDLKHYLILDKVLVPGIILAVVYSLLTGRLLPSVTSALLLSGFFLLLFLVSRGRWIGAGDIKLGLFLGSIAPFPETIALFFIAYLSGAIFSLGLLASGKKNMADRLPFGTFLAFATFCVMLWGEQLTTWYLKLIGIY